MNSVKKCELSGHPFNLPLEYKQLLSEISPVINGIKYSLPFPRLSPNERLRRRLSFRNERILYKNKCIISGKPIVSIYSPESPYKVCDKNKWLELDNIEFGREIDFDRPFFEQFYELQLSTYKAAVIQAGEIINSDYAHFCGYLKDCYLLFDSGKAENCFYGVYNIFCKDCIDCSYVLHSELCYESINLQNCYSVFFSDFCKNSNFSAFLKNCIGCTNCLFCSNLRNQKFCYMNKQLSEAEFRAHWNEVFDGSFASLENAKSLYLKFLRENEQVALRNINAQACSGELLSFCENVHESVRCSQAKNLWYCSEVHSEVENCIDYSSFGESAENSYELNASGGYQGKIGISNCYFSSYIYYGGYNILYSSHCHEQSQNLFGCCDLRRKQFCILNKQYSEKEYYVLVDKLIRHMHKTGEWGEFIPSKYSPFGYNESLAQERFPLSEGEAKKRGLGWCNYKSAVSEVGSVDFLDPTKPIYEIDSQVYCKGALRCKSSHKPFRLIAKEIEFYKNNNLPIPLNHPEERHKIRISFHLNDFLLTNKTCAHCDSVCSTSYSDSSIRVICQNCFNKIDT